jgi:hypothetical protein
MVETLANWIEIISALIVGVQFFAAILKKILLL